MLPSNCASKYLTRASRLSCLFLSMQTSSSSMATLARRYRLLAGDALREDIPRPTCSAASAWRPASEDSATTAESTMAATGRGSFKQRRGMKVEEGDNGLGTRTGLGPEGEEVGERGMYGGDSGSGGGEWTVVSWASAPPPNPSCSR